MAPVWASGATSAALTGWAASRVAVVDASAPTGAAPSFGLADAAPHLPGTLALSLVLLACWGVLLVTHGRVRTLVAGLGAVAATAALALAVLDARHLRADLADAASSQGRTPGEIGFTPWFWLALVAGATARALALVATRQARRWPAMGSRYDAPGTPARPATGAGLVDLWRAQDEGADPTAPEGE
ncbi:MAG: Trp biosynthesis-associated membrane protein [Nocardioides sp.]